MLAELEIPIQVVEPTTPVGNSYNVKEAKWGAKGNGSTDDYTPIQNAINQANTNYLAGTGTTTVFFPSGTYITGTKLVWKTGVVLKGEGWNHSVIKAKSGSNLTALVETEAYGSTGVYACQAFDLRFDGDINNNPTGGTNLKLDGQNFTMQRCISINTKGRGLDLQITSETKSATEGYDSRFLRVRCINTRDYGFYMNAHDAIYDDCQAIQCTEGGFNQKQLTYMVNCHSWCYSSGETVCKTGYVLNGECIALNCIAEGASEAQVKLLGANTRWIGGDVFSSTGKPNVPGFEINGGTAFDVNGVYCKEYGTGGAFKFTTDGGSGSKVRAHCFDASSNPAGVGTPNEGMQFDVTTGGSGGWGTLPISQRRQLTLKQFTPGTIPNSTIYVNNADVLLKWKDTAGTIRVIGTPSEEEVASANTMTIGSKVTAVKVSGTTEIKKITATYAGHVVVFRFLSTPTVTKGENLKIKENFVTTADDTLTAYCDGTNWYEMGRSVN